PLSLHHVADRVGPRWCRAFARSWSADRRALCERAATAADQSLGRARCARARTFVSQGARRYLSRLLSQAQAQRAGPFRALAGGDRRQECRRRNDRMGAAGIFRFLLAVKTKPIWSRASRFNRLRSGGTLRGRGRISPLVCRTIAAQSAFPRCLARKRSIAS